MKKRTNIYIVNALLVLSIFIIILLHNNVFPFGNKIISVSDATFQFIPLVYDYLTKIRLGIIGTYSFNNGLGNPYLFDILYYISSPLNYLLIFIKDPYLIYYLSIVIKLILTSVFMTKYVKTKSSNNTTIIIATLSYCFSSWFYTYYYYSSFLDVFMIFPLFQYGLEKVLNKEFSISYIFSLNYMMISNFYLCFSVCLYTIIYFILSNLYKKNSFKDILSNFTNLCRCSIWFVLISFFWLYALIDSYIRMGMSFEKVHNLFYYYIYFKRFISSLFYGNFMLVISASGEKYPNIACPTIILISIFYYFLNRNINKRKKIFALIGIILSLLAIFFSPFDFVLNFFHQIRGLTYRYSFIICFLSILLFIDNMNNINIKDSNTKKRIIICVLLVLILNIYCYHLQSKQALIIEFLGISSIVVITLLYQHQKIYKKLLIIPIIMQIIIANSLTFSTEGYPHIFNENFKIKDDKYRLVDSKYYCNQINNNFDLYNCNLYTNNKVLDLYTSMTYNNVIYDLNKLGISTAMNTTIISNSRDILVNMLLNVQGQYYLEKIYSVKKEVLNTKLKKDSIVDNQKSLIKNMTGIDSVFKSNKVKGIFKYRVNYYDINNSYYYIDVYNNKGVKKNILSTTKNFAQTKNKYNDEITYYLYDMKKIKEIYTYLQKKQIKYSYYSDSLIEGKINVDKDQIIFTSIPYDTNWDIYLDGKKVKPVKILNSLMGIEASEGNHTLKLEYKYHLLIPTLISILSFISLLFRVILKKGDKTIAKRVGDKKC